MISGTRNVGNRLSGSSRNACIDSQSFKPNRSALRTTKMISINPIEFQMSRDFFANLECIAATTGNARAATMMSPQPAALANAQGN